jgi:methyltransferase OMS1
MIVLFVTLSAVGPSRGLSLSRGALLHRLSGALVTAPAAAVRVLRLQPCKRAPLRAAERIFCRLVSLPQHAVDALPQRVYDRAAPTYDALDGGTIADTLGLTRLRTEATGLCTGKVLEVGVGTGLNLPLYDARRCERLTAVDLSAGMLAEASSAAAARSSSLPVELLQMDAEALSFGDSSFDCVLDSFSLCVYAHPQTALAEMRRVCRPGGRVVLLEHARSDATPLALYQDATATAASQWGGKGYAPRAKPVRSGGAAEHARAE